MFTRIDHIGIAVADLDQAIRLYRDTMGMRLSHREVVDSQALEAALLDIGDGHIELMSPLYEDSVIGKFIARKGEGMHHVAYAVPDINLALREAKAAGMEPIDAEPRIGIRQSKVVFFHPRSTGGVLTELVQPSEEH
ncbi:MAG TPA: methylmalonyl-CoA epimerase [Solirubrobacterales bacterium]|nr:methylmalonyl-CoA epimerase [Solirubrobacterales bacterium]